VGGVDGVWVELMGVDGVDGVRVELMGVCGVDWVWMELMGVGRVDLLCKHSMIFCHPFKFFSPELLLISYNLFYALFAQSVLARFKSSNGL